MTNENDFVKKRFPASEFSCSSCVEVSTEVPSSDEPYLMLRVHEYDCFLAAFSARLLSSDGCDTVAC